MTNCDDLQRQLAAAEAELARIQGEMAYTQRVSRQISDSPGSDVSAIWRNFVGVADSPAVNAAVRRSLGERETPVGMEGRFTNFAQLADRFDDVQAQEMGAVTEALLGNWETRAPGDYAFVTATTTPEQFAGWVANGYRDLNLNYDAMLKAASRSVQPFMQLVENGTRLRTMADISKHNLVESIAALRGFMQEAGDTPPTELGARFVEAYKKALILERHNAKARRSGGQYLQSLQRSIGEPGDLPAPTRDIWAPPEATPDAPGGDPLNLTPDDLGDDTLIGKVLQAIDQGPDGVEALKQLELDIRIDSIDPEAALDRLWRSPGARRDLGYFKDSWFWNFNTQAVLNLGSNAVMERVGLLRTAIENGPMMAPFGTKLFRTSMKDRLEGVQVAWEANKQMGATMNLGAMELYKEGFLTGNTPFANDVTVHGRSMDPEEALRVAREVWHKPIANPWTNIADFSPGGKGLLGDEGLLRDLRDKIHVGTRLTIHALLKKATGIDFPINQAFAGLAAVDNVAGMRLFRFKMRNDLLMQARKDGLQLGLLDDAGIPDTQRVNDWVNKKMEDAVYQEIPTEQNLIDFRRKHSLTAEMVDDEQLRAYMIKSKRVVGYPVLADDLSQRAWDYADKMRFQNTPDGPLGGTAYKVAKAVQESSWIGDAVLAPVIKMPINGLIFDVMEMGLGPTVPTLKYLNEKLHGRMPTAAQTAQVEAAWVTSGLLAAAFFALDNDTGKLTGNGPVDPRARQQWMTRMKAEGRVPNSVYGIPIPLGGIPILNTLFLWKDVKDAMEAAGASQMDTRKVGMGMMQILTGAIVRQTTLAMMQRLLELSSRGDEQAWGKFAGWVASGQFNPFSGPTRMIERYSGSTRNDMFEYPNISPADEQLIAKAELPPELQFTRDGIKNLLVNLQPLAGRIAGIPYRETDWLGRAIHLPEGMDQEGFPSGFPGFYNSPVHRELEKQQLLDPPTPLLSAHHKGVPLSPEVQKELNGYIGTIVGEDDFPATRYLAGQAFTYAVQGREETIIDLPNGSKVRFGVNVPIPTVLGDAVARAVKGRTVYQAMEHLFRSPEYKAIQANKLTSSNPEVNDLPPAARLQQPGPWMIRAVKSYYENRAIWKLDGSDTEPAQEYQRLMTAANEGSLQRAIEKVGVLQALPQGD